MPSREGTQPGRRSPPRIIPLLAWAFLLAWLGRNLVLDVGTLSAAPHTASEAVATETYTAAFTRLAPLIPAAASVDLVIGPGIDRDSAYWWATYYLYPHNIRVNPGAAAAPADLVVVAQESEMPPGMTGYRVVERLTGPRAVVVAYLRDGL